MAGFEEVDLEVADSEGVPRVSVGVVPDLVELHLGELGPVE